MERTNMTTSFSENHTELLQRFSNHLFARCGLAEGSINLCMSYVKRLLPVVGTHPSQESLDGYVAAYRRRKTSYGDLTNCMKAIERFM